MDIGNNRDFHGRRPACRIAKYDPLAFRDTPPTTLQPNLIFPAADVKSIARRIYWTIPGNPGIFPSMDNSSSNEVLPRPEKEHLPAVPMALPAAEVLKHILEQMLENERRRVRNEFIRFSSLFLVLVLLILGGGFWIVRDVLSQVKEARLMSEHSQEALLALVAAGNRPTSAPAGPEAAPSFDNPSEIQQAIANLEGQNRMLAALMQNQNQNGNFKNLLGDLVKTRDEEIRKLRARIDARHAEAIAAKPDDWEAAPLQPSVNPPEQTELPTIRVSLPDQPMVKSLTAAAAEDLPLRLPIPIP
jgi:hypothetical protein